MHEIQKTTALPQQFELGTKSGNHRLGLFKQRFPVFPQTTVWGYVTIKRLPCDPQDVVCDIGCGKGRLVCWFARQPVARVIGIDLDPELTAAAETNLQHLRQRQAKVEIRTEDATASDFDDVTVFVMNNPFGADVMNAVLESIRSSLVRSPRRIRLAYITPVQAHVVDQADFLELVEEFPYIYDNTQQSARIYATR